MSYQLLKEAKLWQKHVERQGKVRTWMLQWNKITFTTRPQFLGLQKRKWWKGTAKWTICYNYEGTPGSDWKLKANPKGSVETRDRAALHVWTMYLSWRGKEEGGKVNSAQIFDAIKIYIKKQINFNNKINWVISYETV